MQHTKKIVTVCTHVPLNGRAKLKANKDKLECLDLKVINLDPNAGEVHFLHPSGFFPDIVVETVTSGDVDGDIRAFRSYRENGFPLLIPPLVHL